MDLPGGWGQTNTGLVVGDDAAMVIDTAWDRPRARALAEAAAELTAGVPITEAVNTHSDGDHWWGNGTLPAAARITTSVASLEAMTDETPPGAVARFSALGAVAGVLPGPAGSLGRYMRQVTGGADLPRRLPRLPDHTFETTETITVGGRDTHLRTLGPAHTPGDLIIHLPDAGVVFSGDLLFIGSTPIIWHGPLGNWTDALDHMIGLDAETYVPGHGPICGRTEIELLRDYWQWVEEAGRAHFVDGTPPLRAAREMLRSAEFTPFSQWGSSERIVVNLGTLYRLWDGRQPAPPTFARRARAFADAGTLQRELAR
ncbi:MBL fold metallo-hydrolase [Williamsia soli]|uniref:MBL fold metallo-hydrolase n=1 Tax=Williamsia soli TaxID=364929 RepID=UPI001F3F0323|nr:MBL fold metallo-hydrolase [Williamsia soli]